VVRRWGEKVNVFIGVENGVMGPGDVGQDALSPSN